jgi:hypothetical protein
MFQTGCLYINIILNQMQTSVLIYWSKQIIMVGLEKKWYDQRFRAIQDKKMSQKMTVESII